MIDPAESAWWWRYTADDIFTARTPIFLDRDGVINVDHGYVHRPEDVELTAGAGEAVRAFNQAGLPVVVVTNQAGIGRGYYDWPAFEATQQEIQHQLARFGAHMDAAFASPHHADGKPPYNDKNHSWRKPNPGMLLAAQGHLGLDVARAWIVGDSVTDLQAGARAGLMGGVLMGSKPHQRQEVPQITWPDGYQVRGVETLWAASQIVVP